jgi:hypothetical protein
MESINLFEQKKIRVEKRSRPLWLILAISAILPGLGHFLLGKKHVGIGILSASVLATVLGSYAQSHSVAYVLWIALRAGFALGLFAVIDASLLCVELADGRHKDYPVRPRLAAFMSLVTYGGGFWLMELKGLAATALVAGVLLHLLLAPLHWTLAVIAELALAAFAVQTYRMALARRAPKPSRRLVEQVATRAPDTTPAWMIPGFVISTAVTVVALLTTLLVARALDKATDVRQQGAVAMEPYYRNPNYGLSMELKSPGWKFDEPAPDEFVTARHVGEDAAARLAVRPRLPLLGNSRHQAEAVLRQAREGGYQLRVEGGTPCQMGTLNGYELRARGTHLGKMRNVRIVSAGSGWREYVLWFEWGDKQQEFAQHELDYVLRHVQVGKH